MSEPIKIDSNVTCAGCGKAMQYTAENTSVGDKYSIKIKVDWRPHAMCAAGFLKEPGQA
jgi:hypothetical protein